MRRRRIVAVVLILFALFGTAAPAGATVPVYDYINWILAFIQRYYAAYQRAQQLYQQAEAVKAAYKNLENYGRSGEWGNLVGLYGSIEGILNRADNLGFQTSELAAQLDETFPGLIPPQDYRTEYETRVRKTLTTVKSLTQILGRIAAPNVQTQLRLAAMQARSGDASGAVKALQTANIFASLQEEELGRGLQAELASANIEALTASHELQKEAAAEAAFVDWTTRDEGPAPEPVGYGGVPAGWSW